LYCWGANLSGQIGDGSLVHPQLSLTKVGSTGAWALAEAGAMHTCAISTGKSLYCWGDNNSGAIGDGTAGPGFERRVPTKIGTSGAWARVSAGGALNFSHTCAVSTGKSLYCWGNDFYDQIGDGVTGVNRFSPRKIGTSGVWAGSTAGGLHACAISTGNSLYCWGNNGSGNLGDGTFDQRPSPTKVP
jgi:alpha-tubulin suppressor-like RCC1 family protein